MSYNRIRHEVWERMERGRLTLRPRPCYYRVPNFVGVAEATRRLAEQPEFQAAACVLCATDHVLEEMRRRVLASGRSLALIYQEALWEVSSLDAQEYDTLLWLGRIASLGQPLHTPVGLVVIGSIAVDPNGVRVGRRQCQEEEVLRALLGTALLPAETPIATIVHEAQIYSRIPSRGGRGPRVDIIATPERVLRVETKP